MSFSRRAVRLTLVCAAPVALAAALPAAAQRMVNQGMPPSDPLMAMAEDDAGPGTFFLNGSDDVELVRFHKTHDMSICAARPNPAAVDPASHGYPLMVTWDGDSAIVRPGNCLYFEAQRVKVRPASPLPQNIVLTGHLMVLD